MTDPTRTDRSARSASPPRRRLRPAAVAVALASAMVLLASGCVMDGTWTANVVPPVPIVHPSQYELNDVSCVSATWCLAVGTNHDPIVQIWNGTAWTPGTPPPDGPWDGGMESVDCGAVDRCMGVVDRLPDSPTDYQYLVAWNGTSWVDVPPGEAIDGSDITLFSCATDGCVVVNTQQGIVVVWDGSEFTTLPFTSDDVGGASPASLSCAAIDDCLAVSYWATAHWDGTGWTVLETEQLSALGVDYVWGVDCASSVRCAGVGYGGIPDQIHLITWDGTSWADEAAPTWTYDVPADIACASGAECVLVLNRHGGTALAWNGISWEPAPPLPGGSTATYRGISCTKLRCLAVGATAPPAPQLLAATYTWTNS
jgi:hypothetical protein